MATTIRPVRLADIVAVRLQTMILEGVLRPGERLLSERELAEVLGVSRPSLRDGIAILERKGLVITTKTGTSVVNFLDRQLDTLTELLAGNARGIDDYLEFRCIIESKAAALAARRATSIDRDVIAGHLDAMRAAYDHDDQDEEAHIDDLLHRSIYEAAHNVVILHLMATLGNLQKRTILYSRDQFCARFGTRQALLDQHLALGQAVIDGDTEAASRLAMQHINFVSDVIDEMRNNDQRRVTANSRVGRTAFLHAPAPHSED